MSVEDPGFWNTIFSIGGGAGAVGVFVWRLIVWLKKSVTASVIDVKSEVNASEQRLCIRINTVEKVENERKELILREVTDAKNQSQIATSAALSLTNTITAHISVSERAMATLDNAVHKLNQHDTAIELLKHDVRNRSGAPIVRDNPESFEHK